MTPDQAAPAGDEISSLRAAAHPLRLRMLSLLTGAAMSAAELARELDVTHANASYHLRVLHEAGLVDEAGEERIRGGVARRYRHRVGQGGSTGARLGPEVEVMAQELLRRHRGSAEPDPGVRGPSVLADAELWLDPEAWAEVVGLLRRAAEQMHERARPPRTDGTVRASLTLAAFRMPA